jgi:hypothetical protein
LQKEIKVFQATIKTLNSKVENQLQLTLEANLEKERLKIRKEEILLQKEEARKRRSMELKELDGRIQQEVAATRARFIQEIHSSKDILKRKNQQAKLDDSSKRIRQATLMHQQAAQATPAGCFPNMGGGPGSMRDLVHSITQQSKIPASFPPQIHGACREIDVGKRRSATTSPPTDADTNGDCRAFCCPFKSRIRPKSDLFTLWMV